MASKSVYIKMTSITMVLCICISLFFSINVVSRAASSVPAGYMTLQDLYSFLNMAAGYAYTVNGELQGFDDCDDFWDYFLTLQGNATSIFYNMPVTIPDIGFSGSFGDIIGSIPSGFNYETDGFYIEAQYVSNNVSDMATEISTVHKSTAERLHGGSYGSFDTAAPIDGVEVKTNFSDFSIYPNGENFVSDNYKYFFSTLSKDYCFDNGFNYLYFSCLFSNDSGLSVFSRLSLYNISDLGYFIPTYNSNGVVSLEFFNKNGVGLSNPSIFLGGYISRISTSYPLGDDYFYFNNNSEISYNLKNIISFSNSSGYSYSATNNNGYNVIFSYSLSLYSDIPIVIASSQKSGLNYLIWKKGTPSGIYYTTTNIDNSTYTTEYITNNNWENAYNNYITDVSNYYSTTENIDNSTLSQYIDNSTTITNITNNYIDNSSGGDGGDDNDIITNSWLERIYNKLSDFYDSFLSYIRGDVQNLDGDTYITNNYVTNEIYYTLPQSIFPNVPIDDLIGTAEEFSVDLFTTKMAAIAAEVVPFCFLFSLGSIATVLAHEPSPPYWELPFNIDSYGIEESVVLDMTSDVWNNIHTVWITLFMIAFIAFLAYLTMKIINMISNLLA